MQDLFEEPLTLLDHHVSGYGGRTVVNARKADLTVAFATNFYTHGEILTKRAAGLKYCCSPYGGSTKIATDTLIEALKKYKVSTLNVAGNGIYTLHPIEQTEINQWVYEVIRNAHKAYPIKHIRSGGQTGVDTAGLVAALVLCIPATGLFPKDFRRRIYYMGGHKETYSNKSEIFNELYYQSLKIKP